VAPVLPLALVPLNHGEPSRAYGLLDSLKSLTQAALMLLLGALREMGGFQAAISFACLPLSGLVAGLSVLLASNMADGPLEASKDLQDCDALDSGG